MPSGFLNVEHLIPLLPDGPGPATNQEISFEGREADSLRSLRKCARFPKVSAGSYPPTKSATAVFRLVIKGSDMETIGAACDWLEPELMAQGLDTERRGP